MEEIRSRGKKKTMNEEKNKRSRGRNNRLTGRPNPLLRTRALRHVLRPHRSPGASFGVPFLQS